MATSETIIVATVIALVGVLWLVLPFIWRGEDDTATDDLTQLHLDTLKVYYAQVVSTLRDLDEDFATHKMNAEDYEAEREAWTARGVKVLGAINQVQAQSEQEQQERAKVAPPTAVPVAMQDDDIDAAIEAAVRKALGAK